MTNNEKKDFLSSCFLPALSTDRRVSCLFEDGFACKYWPFPFRHRTNILRTVLICLALFTRLNTEAAEIPLVPRAHVDSALRVKTILEVAGSLHVETLDKKPVQIPTKVNAELFYDEVGLQGELAPSVRHYWGAKAEFQFAEDKLTRVLREDRQLIALSDDDSPNRFWSPHGMLAPR